MRNAFLLSLIAAAFLTVTPALADDWTVSKLRGTVQQQVDGQWVDLARGDIVPDDRLIRTLADGHLDLVRGKEVLTLSANTQIQVHDQADPQFTTVTQDFGQVEVEADVQNVQHFAVQTQFLAAVVKGTHFTVDAGWYDSSVSVARGHVAVQSMSTGRNTLLSEGQNARVEPTTDLVVAGIGQLPPVLAPESGALRPSFEVTAATFNAGDSSAQPVQQTAMLAGPANAGAIDRLVNGDAGAALPMGATAAAAVTTTEAPPVNIVTIFIGLLIGAAIGAVALLFRRSVG